MKFRIAVVCSILWLLFRLYDDIPFIEHSMKFAASDLIATGIAPLVILWGIWWIIKAKKK